LLLVAVRAHEFLEGFPTVSREQVIAFLEEAKESVLARAVLRTRALVSWKKASYLANAGASWRMIFRSKVFTDFESENTFATSGFRTTTFVPLHNAARISRAGRSKNRIRRASAFAWIY
jgi:hypothetical protein